MTNYSCSDSVGCFPGLGPFSWERAIGLIRSALWQWYFIVHVKPFHRVHLFHHGRNQNSSGYSVSILNNCGSINRISSFSSCWSVFVSSGTSASPTVIAHTPTYPIAWLSCSLSRVSASIPWLYVLGVLRISWSSQARWWSHSASDSQWRWQHETRVFSVLSFRIS